ncbi:MAG: gamma carbonic anhydrase family protein [Pseudomonadota bacterium]
MPVLPLPGKKPRIDPTALVLEPSVVVGDVEIGAQSSVWFGSVIRGDVHSIRIGKRTNIQDLSMVHVTSGTGPCTIGDDVTVGHNAVIHACTIGDRILIGMGAIILDNAVIGSDSLIGAGSLVPSRMEIPSGVLVMGSPARIKRELTEAEKASLLESAQHYVAYQEMYR